MTVQALATLLVLAATIVAFVLNRWRPDLIAVGVLLILALAGIVTTEEAVGGFGMPAVVAVAAVFVISAGLERTGAAMRVSHALRRLAGRSQRRMIVLLMAACGLLAAVMINLAAVSVLLPVAAAIADRRRMSPTLLLLPLAYAALFGGKLTVFGGPSNLLIADILQRNGIATLGLLDFLPVGLPLLVVGTAWMATVGWRNLPPQPPEDLLRAVKRHRTRLVGLYRLSERLFEVRIPAGSPLLEKTIEQSELGRTHGVTIVAVVRNGRQISFPSKSLVLQSNDRLVVAGRLDELLEAKALDRMGIELARAEDIALDTSEGGVVESVVSPRSELAGRTLREIGFRDRYGLTALALWREGRPFRTRLAEMPLQVGDGLLIWGPRKALRALRGDPDFIVLEEDTSADVRADKMIHALLAVVIMIGLAIGGIHIALAAGTAAALMLLSGGLTAEEAYRAIDWRSIVLLGAMIPLGVALDKTGAAGGLTDRLVAAVGGSPIAVLAVIMVVGVAIAHFVPTIASTVLLAPVALHAAKALGASGLPFAMAIMAAMGLTLLTPFGNPVMLVVMSPGGYTLRDYVRSGLPVVVLLIVVMLLVIPLAYPFFPSATTR
ncbi:MAG: SLC13 family permease [bacterium]